METTVFANQTRFDAEAAWEIVRNFNSIITAKGKKIETWDPAKDDKEVILKKIMGPSGNLRAPSFRVGDDFYVGFNPELYEELFGA